MCFTLLWFTSNSTWSSPGHTSSCSIVGSNDLRAIVPDRIGTAIRYTVRGSWWIDRFIFQFPNFQSKQKHFKFQFSSPPNEKSIAFFRSAVLIAITIIIIWMELICFNHCCQIIIIIVILIVIATDFPGTPYLSSRCFHPIFISPHWRSLACVVSVLEQLLLLLLLPLLFVLIVFRTSKTGTLSSFPCSTESRSIQFSNGILVNRKSHNKWTLPASSFDVFQI